MEGHVSHVLSARMNSRPMGKSRQPGQRSGESVFGVYLQTAPAELWQVERGGQSGTETACGEIGLAEKSNPAVGTEITIRQIPNFSIK